MVLVIALLVLLLVVLAAASTFTPWPFEVSACCVGLACGGTALLLAHDAFTAVCAALLPVCGLLTLQTVRQTLAAARAARQIPRRRAA